MKGTVLIVDEDVNALVIAETLLRAHGLRVGSTVDGHEACAIVRGGGATVVVLDLALTGMNGFEVIRRLRSRFEGLPPATQPRVLAVSERVDLDAEHFALRLGADAYLRKPLDPRQFINTVEQLMALPARRPQVRRIGTPPNHAWFDTPAGARSPLLNLGW